MACPNTLLGIDKNCTKAIGGTHRKTYFWLQDDLVSESIDAAQRIYTELTFERSGTPSLPVVFNYSKNSASLAENFVIDNVTENGVNTVTFTLQVAKLDYAKHKAISVMAKSGELVAGISDRVGNYWIVKNLELTTVDTNTGTASADFNGYNLTFTAEVDDLIMGVEKTDFEQLIATGSFDATYNG